MRPPIQTIIAVLLAATAFSSCRGGEGTSRPNTRADAAVEPADAAPIRGDAAPRALLDAGPTLSMDAALVQAPDSGVARACGASGWCATSIVNAPAPGLGATVIWTGSRMLVWGGGDRFPCGGSAQAISPRGDGAAYDPTTDTWTALPPANAPSPRACHTAVWTGTEMIVWGGNNSPSYLRTGGRYDPARGTWTALPTEGAPKARSQHTAIWTGTEMIVWGGRSDSNDTLGDAAARYNPRTNLWTPVPNPSGLVDRSEHVAVWTGSEMIVWGGYSNTLKTYFADGARFNPTTNVWTPIAPADMTAARRQATGLWTATDMLIWAGFSSPAGYDAWATRYTPGTDRWTPVPNPPHADFYGRGDATAVWTGSEVMVWGGGGNLGARLHLATGQWTPIPTDNAPSGRYDNSAVWTGTEMIVWGGESMLDGNLTNTGGRYRP
jgi:hypothetical protein